MQKNWIMKKARQPMGHQSTGCIFKNPGGISAGMLIDQAGLKGSRVGGAEVSERHANFVVAEPDATSQDVLQLIDLMRTHRRRAVGRRVGNGDRNLVEAGPTKNRRRIATSRRRQEAAMQATKKPRSSSDAARPARPLVLLPIGSRPLWLPCSDRTALLVLGLRFGIAFETMCSFAGVPAFTASNLDHAAAVVDPCRN